MSEKLILQNLNPEQQKACQILSGPILILAGAGTGKTRTITYRVAYLISQGISPENILAVTFTNKAAGEMKERMNKLLVGQASMPDNARQTRGSALQALNIGTFHSICARILRYEARHLGYSSNFVIYDEIDQANVVKKIMEDLDIDPKKFSPGLIVSMISGAKTELIDFKEYQEKYASEFLTQVVSKIYEPYQKYLKENNAMDFDDLIFNCILLFEKFPEILKKYQQKFKYILVDEYQDTNHLQYVFINLLARDHRNLCVCGDDWQSIYGFRQADIRNILNFENDYKETKIVKLEQNYRSTQNILDIADFVIKQNSEQKEKNLWTKKGKGTKIIVFEALSETHEAEFITSEIENCQQENKKLKYSDFVVLYRTHHQSRAIEEMFLQKGIPYKVVGGIKFYERKEIKDIIAYLRLISNPKDGAAFSRIINEPARGLGVKTVSVFKKFVKEKGLDFISAAMKVKEIDGILPKAKSALSDFAKFYKKCEEKRSKQKLTELINWVCRESGYRKYLLEGKEDGEIRWENVKELLSVARKYDSEAQSSKLKAQNHNSKLKSYFSNSENEKTENRQTALELFLEEVALFSDIDEWDEKEEAVTLMTLHAAKGLEFEVVFLAGLEENLLPHSKSLLELSGLEEERRLCYVGMTRAKNYLYLVYAKSRKMFGQMTENQISRFIQDLPEELVEKY